MMAVTELALARLNASIQNSSSVNSSFGSWPMGWTMYTSLSRMDSLTRTKMFPSENLMVVASPSCVPRYAHIFLAKGWPVLPAKILMMPAPVYMERPFCFGR